MIIQILGLLADSESNMQCYTGETGGLWSYLASDQWCTGKDTVTYWNALILEPSTSFNLTYSNLSGSKGEGGFTEFPKFHLIKQSPHNLYCRTRNLISVTENYEEISSSLNLESFVLTES